MYPKGSSKIRYGLKKCNTHVGNGDEVCIAKQDLILAIVGSGSLRESDFKSSRTSRLASSTSTRAATMDRGQEDRRGAVWQRRVSQRWHRFWRVLIQPMRNGMGKVK